MISFELDEEQQLIRDNVRSFAADRLFVDLRKTEAERGLPADVVKGAHELGLGTLGLPEAVGGEGVPLVTRCLVEEAIAWGDPAAAWALAGPGALGPMLVELGDESQQKDVLSRFTATAGHDRRGAVAWSEARPTGAGFMTTARRDGDAWFIGGMKSFVVNGGVADRYVVFAQVDADAGWGGIGAFVVDADAKGLSAGPRRQPIGLDAVHVADVMLEEVRVPAAARLGAHEGLDFTVALSRAFARHSLVVAARAIGCAGRAWELTRDYCTERHAFGKPIGHFQAVAFNVADRLMDVEAARWMLWRAASEWDRNGEPDLVDVAAATANAIEAALRCGNDGVQLFGGAGFIRDYPIEKFFRDGRQIGLMGPTIETLDAIVAERELGRPPDPAALWPTSDIQPVCI